MTIDSFDGDFFFLSNFFPHSIMYMGKIWKTSEHAFQGAKTLDESEQETIRRQITPGQAKRKGRKITLRPDWENIKVSVMREILKIKFSDPVLAQMLLDTGDNELIEGNDWGDTFYGRVNGVGENWLGRILMEIREELRNPVK